jgi:hypothetical protein
MTKLRIAAAALAALTILGSTAEVSAQRGCVSRGDARRMLESREVAPFPDALNRAGIRRQRLVGDVELCGGRGNYVYRFRMLRPDGRVDHREIPAR